MCEHVFVSDVKQVIARTQLNWFLLRRSTECFPETTPANEEIVRSVVVHVQKVLFVSAGVVSPLLGSFPSRRTSHILYIYIFSD